MRCDGAGISTVFLAIRMTEWLTDSSSILLVRGFESRGDYEESVG